MTTPTERLELKRMLAECRVCAWLVTLGPTDRKAWDEAIANLRFSHDAVASEIREDQASAEYNGLAIGESSVETHRKRGHA
jgi:hypothetical protein